ncbi:spermidine synthase [Streptomyces sp. NPDC005438]|uniref:spermidine synthase n=1 Tax=Streptomyces sp. NPDC005438 TaxID=3156880 RepID=UPI0033A2E3AE
MTVSHPDPTPAQPQVVDRRTGVDGEVVLRRHGTLWQIIANGTFLMDTSNGESERLLISATLDRLRAHAPHPTPVRPALLIGGLGVGFSLAEACAHPDWSRIEVVEREEAVIDWHRDGPLGAFTARALADPRTELVHADLLEHLRTTDRRYDALCLDIDNGPDWTVSQDNDTLYSPTGLADCARCLNPGGTLAVWSAQPSPKFDEALRDNGFVRVGPEEVPVARGVPDVIHFAAKPA